MRPTDDHDRPPTRWHRASRTVAPALAILGCLILVAEAVRRLQALDRAARVMVDVDLYAWARQDAWLLLLTGILAGVLGVLLVFVRAGRLGWAVGLTAIGLGVIVHWGDVINALPFLAAAVLAYVPDDERLHPRPVQET